MKIHATMTGRSPSAGPAVMAMVAMVAMTMVAMTMVAACTTSAASSPSVPSLGHGSGGTAAAGQSHASALHAAAQCIRQHGIPAYQDPVLTPSGQVYSDSHSFLTAPQSTVNAVRHACRTLMAEAHLDPHPQNEPPAPPQLVQAGVRAAECERLHGLPHVQDPTAQSPYTPGGGFRVSVNELPPGGKGSPGYQQASHACRSLMDAEIRASTLSSLSNGG